MSSKVCIVLDAGHGGKDSGAVSNQVLEKDLVLDLVLRTAEELSKYECEIVLTRDKDEFIGLTDRVNKATEEKASCLISFHINAATNKDANGFETFIREGNPNPSKSLQESIHKELATLWTSQGRRDRGMKLGRFTVLRYQPSVLVEFGFISNYLDLELLLDESFKRNQVNALVKALVTHFKLKESKVPIEQTEWYKKFMNKVFV